MSIDTLPPLRDVIERFDLKAKKSLGQNFLYDLNLTAKIARQAGDLKDQQVIEVGPGPGGLTRALLAQGAFVTAIERDKRCLSALEEVAAHYPSRLRIIEGDALQQDFSKLFSSGSKPKIVANLPYNIGTQLLLNWLLSEPWPPFYASMTLMFQREVAQRITAEPNTKHYGRLSILSGWRVNAKIVMDIPPQAFTPPPKVTSSVIHLVPRENPTPCDAKKLGRVTHAAFGQRRKMLRQSLKGLNGEILLEKTGIDKTRRAETLNIEEFLSLANAL